jgi:ribonuclease BN (tRNA processing enzyme)
MKLIILGSGTTVPSLSRNAAGYYIQIASQECLIDCGSGVLVQLERVGKSYQTLDKVFITHTHPDHIGDLIRLIQALKFTPGFQRKKTLTLFGPKGFPAFFANHVVPLVGKPGQFSIEVNEVDEALEFTGFRVLTSPTVHSEALNSVAYRFEEKGKSTVLSGDCDYDDGIIRLAHAADLMVIDCSFPDALKVKGHLAASECGQVARKANVKQLILSHLYPVPPAEDKRLAECRAVFSGPVRLAEDFLVIEI